LFVAAIVYGLLVGASWFVRHARKPAGDDAGLLDRAMVVRAVDGDRLTDESIRIAYRDYPAASGRALATVVMIHGSPGAKEDFARLAPVLAATSRVVVPDLPGFGGSTRDLPDYSFRGHALYLRQLIDRLGLPPVHVVAYSMGGGVALNLIDAAPGRVASLALLSAIGVQEMELTGSYHINHLLHAGQLALVWLLREGTPHMGRLDDVALGVPYARNFYDSDQRPLRGIIRRVGVPTLIVHGSDDELVPIEAAYEHHRLIPQSELATIAGDHLVAFTSAPVVGGRIGDFVRRAAEGRAPPRSEADPSRMQAADQPFTNAFMPRMRRVAALVTAILTGLGKGLFR